MSESARRICLCEMISTVKQINISFSLYLSFFVADLLKSLLVDICYKYSVPNYSHMMCTKSLDLFTFYNCNSFLLPRNYSFHPPLSLYPLCFYKFNLLYSTYIWDLGVFFFYVWFISLSILSSRFIHITNSKISFLKGWTKLHCMYTRILIHSSTERLSV
jgi:hypothetical protein